MKAHVLPIQLDSSWFLIEAHHVREVLGAEPWLPIPRARAELPGVVVWRGRAVPLVDVARVLGVSTGSAQSRARTLIVHHDSGVAALPVDAAREVRTIAQEDLRPVHGALVPYATRELDEEGDVLTLIDVNAMLSELEHASGGTDDGGA